MKAQISCFPVKYFVVNVIKRDQDISKYGECFYKVQAKLRKKYIYMQHLVEVCDVTLVSEDN